MANPEHVERLREGAPAWNRWRAANPSVTPDLSQPEVSDLERQIATLADAVGSIVMRDRAPANDSPLSGLEMPGVDLHGVNLSRADLSRSILILGRMAGANLQGASLAGCILAHADLSDADLTQANLAGAMLRGAKLRGASLRNAILTMADLAFVDAVGADLQGADLTDSTLVAANLTRANLSGAHVYGVSAWNVILEGAVQANLSITRAHEPTVTLDDLQVAQFLYLILNNRNIRAVIDTVTTKIVLLLGRFKPERKKVLDALRERLRERGYAPVLFDFERPSTRDFTETVVALAHMARFIIADLTEPASLPKELEAIVPGLAVPVQPVIQDPEQPYSMFGDYWKYDWVLEVHRYPTVKDLLCSLDDELIPRAEDKAAELEQRRSRRLSRT